MCKECKEVEMNDEVEQEREFSIEDLSREELIETVGTSILYVFNDALPLSNIGATVLPFTNNSLVSGLIVTL